MPKKVENHATFLPHGGGWNVLFSEQAITIVKINAAWVKNNTSYRGTVTEKQDF